MCAGNPSHTKRSLKPIAIVATQTLNLLCVGNVVRLLIIPVLNSVNTIRFVVLKPTFNVTLAGLCSNVTNIYAHIRETFIKKKLGFNVMSVQRITLSLVAYTAIRSQYIPKRYLIAIVQNNSSNKNMNKFSLHN